MTTYPLYSTATPIGGAADLELRPVAPWTFEATPHRYRARSVLTAFGFAVVVETDDIQHQAVALIHAEGPGTFAGQFHARADADHVAARWNRGELTGPPQDTPPHPRR